MLSNPKRRRGVTAGKASWYWFHAGFSPSFVDDVLTRAALPRRGLVVDPWNGAGTTTQVAHDRGFAAVGYDLNPAMVIVAKARLLDCHVEPSHPVLCEHILRKAARYRASVVEKDPLTLWLVPESARVVRSVERALQGLLVDSAGYEPVARRGEPESISSLAAFYYVALFRTVREMLARFGTTNPTWLRAPQGAALRIRPGREAIAALFERHVRAMAAALAGGPGGTGDGVGIAPPVEIRLANSRSLPLSPNSVDAIIGSPPYCTRIDYAMATRPELAVLGYDAVELRKLRDQMIGTSTIIDATPQPDAAWGTSCNAFLDRVKVHPSRASSSYYWKSHLQYFDGLYSSLIEIQRVLRPGSPCVLVVQDSFYKEVHNDLAAYVGEMTRSIGLVLHERHDYRVEHTLAGLHRHRKTYRSDTHATESVLWVVKPKVDGQARATALQAEAGDQFGGFPGAVLD